MINVGYGIRFSASNITQIDTHEFHFIRFAGSGKINWTFVG